MIDKNQNEIYVKVQRNLYTVLFETGGDKLIAYYMLLKHYLGPTGTIIPFKSSNHRVIKDNRLIATKVPVSNDLILTNHRRLVKTGVVERTFEGVISLLDDEAIHSKYGKAGYVTLKLGKNTVDTGRNIFVDRLEKNVLLQKEAIELKKETIRILGIPSTHRSFDENEILEKSKKFFKREIDVNETVNETVVMSLEKIASIRNPKNPAKTAGAYWKKKLKALGFIQTKRRFEVLQSMNWKEYRDFRTDKSLTEKFPGTPIQKMVYAGGYLCKELVSEFIMPNLVIPVKKTIRAIKQVVRSEMDYERKRVEEFKKSIYFTAPWNIYCEGEEDGEPLLLDSRGYWIYPNRFKFKGKPLQEEDFKMDLDFKCYF